MEKRGSYQKKRDGIWNIEFISICTISALMNISKQMSNSILSKYVDSLGATAAVVGLVSSVFALAALIFKIISGPALDSFSKKRIIFFAMLALGISFAGYSFSGSVSTVVIFRFLQGAAQAFTATCLLTMASEAIPAEKFSTGVGVFALFESAAQAIGPTVGLGLVDVVGYKLTFAIASALMLVSAFAILFFRNDPPTRREKLRITLDRIFAKEAALFSVLLFLFNLSTTVISTYLVIYAARQGIAGNIGLYFTVYACTLLVSRPLIGKLTDRFGVVRTVIPSLCCVIFAFWLISVSSELWMILAAGIVFGFGQGACQPAVQALCMKCVPENRRGVCSSTCYIAQDLGGLIGPVAAGAVIEALGYTAMWRLMSVLTVCAIVFLVAVRKKIKKVESVFMEKRDPT